MPRHLLPLVFALACACADSSPAPTPVALPDGVYEVLAVEGDRAALPAPGPETRVLIHDRKYLRGGSEEPPDYLLLRVPGYAPLDLARPPTQGMTEGRPVLLLALEEDAGKALTELTSRAERAAVVIGGDVVTVHRIRVPIEGGHLQISC
jgi:hypothetical protein